jgi:hypothetical protein
MERDLRLVPAKKKPARFISVKISSIFWLRGTDHVSEGIKNAS